MTRLLLRIKRLWAGSIRRQLTIGVALVHAVLMTIFVFDLVGRQHAFLSQERVNLATELARMLATGTASRVLADDVAGLAEEMDALAAYPGVRYGMIVDATGRVLAHTDMRNAGGYITDPVSRTLLEAKPEIQQLVHGAELIDTAAPIIANDRMIGWARIGLTETDIADSLRSVALNGALYTLMAIVIGTVLAALVARGLTRGLRSLTEVADRIRAGDRAVRAGTARLDEIGRLGAGVNEMIEAIAKSEHDKENMLKTIASSEQALRVTSNNLSTLIDASPIGIVSLDPQQTIVTWNPAAENIFGLSAEKAIGSSYRIVIPEAAAEHFETLVQRVTSGQTIRNVEVKRQRSDGSLIDVSVSAAPLLEDGNLAGIVVAVEDITEQKKAAAQIAHIATHDTLTGLANGERFRCCLHEAIERAKQQNQQVAVLCLSLDRFKEINEALGHSASDTLLQAVAERLQGMDERGMMAARLGGDEFAVLKGGLTGQTEASELASRIISHLGAPYILNGQEELIGASVGIAIGPDDSDDPETLLKQGGVALYRAKGDGFASERFFEPGMDARLEMRRSLERDLRRGLQNGEFEVHYQPLIRLIDGQVSGCEALLRWRHPKRGLVAPGEFIPIAEDTNLIVPIGEWVLRQACNDAAAWPSQLKVAVNLSTVQFQSPRLVSTVISALASSGLSPGRLELEVTESVLMQENAENLALLHQLRGLGARIVMDDFGTGYSSLGYLRSFPFDKIKIDRSFINELPNSGECLAIVRAVVGLGKSLGLSTTAEGVETEEQLERIRTEGCIEGQGYLFSRPVPNAELHRFLSSLDPLSRQTG